MRHVTHSTTGQPYDEGVGKRRALPDVARYFYKSFCGQAYQTERSDSEHDHLRRMSSVLCLAEHISGGREEFVEITTRHIHSGLNLLFRPFGDLFRDTP